LDEYDHDLDEEWGQEYTQRSPPIALLILLLLYSYSSVLFHRDEHLPAAIFPCTDVVGIQPTMCG
jgi:hypothetical protein